MQLPGKLAAIVAIATLLSGAEGRAVTVSGQVTDELGVGIFNVDLDFYDLDLDQIVFTPNDNTDFGGFYSVTVPPGDYDIFFQPPAGSMHLPGVIEGVTISVSTTINQMLEDAHLATGVVQDGAAAPVANVDLDFFDVALQQKYDTVNDNTDASGVFNVLVPDATYDVFFTPPLGLPFAGLVVFNVAVAGTTSLGTVELEPGFFVSGQVVNPSFGGVAQTDLDYVDLSTGDTIFSPRDDTDGAGFFNTPIPAGTYDVIAKSPPGSGWAWKALRDVSVSGDLALGTIQLPTGFTVSGTVRDESAFPVPGTDLDAIDLADGNEIPMPNDNANASGDFALLTGAVTMDLVVQPPAAANLAAEILRGVPVTGNLNLGVITLVAGHPVTGIVRDVQGTPVEGADIDAFELGTGLPYPTFNDDSDASGAYGIRLPAGSYELVATPPDGSGLFPATVEVDPLNGPAVVDFTLPSSTVDAGEGPSVSRLALHQNAPNPFRRRTTIAFDVPTGVTDAKIGIYDVRGRMLRRFLARSGPGTLDWDGRDDRGRALGSGVYLVRLESDAGTVTRKITLLR